MCRRGRIKNAMMFLALVLLENPQNKQISFLFIANEIEHKPVVHIMQSLGICDFFSLYLSYLYSVYKDDQHYHDQHLLSSCFVFEYY